MFRDFDMKVYTDIYVDFISTSSKGVVQWLKSPFNVKFEISPILTMLGIIIAVLLGILLFIVYVFITSIKPMQIASNKRRHQHDEDGDDNSDDDGTTKQMKKKIDKKPKTNGSSDNKYICKLLENKTSGRFVPNKLPRILLKYHAMPAQNLSNRLKFKRQDEIQAISKNPDNTNNSKNTQGSQNNQEAQTNYWQDEIQANFDFDTNSPLNSPAIEVLKETPRMSTHQLPEEIISQSDCLSVNTPTLPTYRSAAVSTARSTNEAVTPLLRQSKTLSNREVNVSKSTKRNIIYGEESSQPNSKIKVKVSKPTKRKMSSDNHTKNSIRSSTRLKLKKKSKTSESSSQIIQKIPAYFSDLQPNKPRPSKEHWWDRFLLDWTNEPPLPQKYEDFDKKYNYGTFKSFISSRGWTSFCKNIVGYTKEGKPIECCQEPGKCYCEREDLNSYKRL